ncbi:Molybdenum cofactor sulfurase [Paratrimastix pyriformis]|uniref:Molybdenum cofactor sulfurase n=1 Tax=Paratrimastix pyriformis TaxID=342808 RepID=A0ABQ8USH1_9EUKA|nr:Molybdenum cofactor sulfurase [Paratrimastix pyriformis]
MLPKEKGLPRRRISLGVVLLAAMAVFLIAGMVWRTGCMHSTSSYFQTRANLFRPVQYVPPPMTPEKQEFLRQYPGYGYTGKIDEIAGTQLTHFKDAVYLDYTGSGVYQQRQLELVMRDLAGNLYGNSHSINPSSQRTDLAVAAVRKKVLAWFNVTSSEYAVIFTSGATGGLKLVGETFPWSKDSEFLYMRADHNSVLGIREYALDRGAIFDCTDEAALYHQAHLRTTAPGLPKAGGNQDAYHLFAFPAECNFSGVKYPLELIDMFHNGTLGMKKGSGLSPSHAVLPLPLRILAPLTHHPLTQSLAPLTHPSPPWPIPRPPDPSLAPRSKYLVLLDAAAFVPTAPLDLHKHPADFVVMSFYKMFGYPSGLGALVVRHDALNLLRKSFFSGGTVVTSASDEHFHIWQHDMCARFEDGTLPFLNIVALKYGFQMLDELGYEPILAHTFALWDYTAQQMKGLKHSNGLPLVEFYGRHDTRDPHRQGPILNFNLRKPDGSYFGYHEVSELAAQNNIHLRTGCSCNPGACYSYLHIESKLIRKLAEEKDTCGDALDVVEGKIVGSIRVSFGYLSTYEHAQALLSFLRSNFLDVFEIGARSDVPF